MIIAAKRSNGRKVKIEYTDLGVQPLPEDDTTNWPTDMSRQAYASKFVLDGKETVTVYTPVDWVRLAKDPAAFRMSEGVAFLECAGVDIESFYKGAGLRGSCWAAWVYQPDAPIPDWVAKRSHSRDCSPYIFVKTVNGITEVRPGEWLISVKGGVRAQLTGVKGGVRATDAA